MRLKILKNNKSTISKRSQGQSKVIVLIGSYADSLINFRGPLLSKLTRRNHQVWAFAPDAGRSVRKKLASYHVNYRNIPIERTGLNPWADVRTGYRLWKMLANIRPDVVIGYTIKPVIYSAMAATLARVPHHAAMITGIGSALDDRNGKRYGPMLISALYKAGLRYSQTIFFQNPDDRRFFHERRLLAKRSKTVLLNGSGIDIDHYRPRPFPERPSFLMISRLLTDKGVREYVAAAAIIKKKMPQMSFRLVGWIDENPTAIQREELQRWVTSGTIEYLGKMEDVRPALADCSVYVLPSYREGLPRTVLEAMATARPVVATNVPGCRHAVVDGETGLLVPAKDPKSLANAMMQLISDPHLSAAMGRKGRLRVEQHFDVRMVNREICSALQL